MTPERMAALHAACFTLPPPWQAPAFVSQLAQETSFLLAREHGFLIGQVVLDEAELLTLAVDPSARRSGIARGLLAEFNDTARARGATRAFLEVAADNHAALALYQNAGWQNAGRRRGYYHAPGHSAVDAVIMTLDL